MFNEDSAVRQQFYDNNYNIHHNKKVKVGNDQEMAQSERNSHSTNLGVGNTILSSDFRPANILRISVQERLAMLMLLSIFTRKCLH